MSYITPAQFRDGMQGAKDYVDGQISAVAVSGSGITPAYIVGDTLYAVDWLSLTDGGDPLVPTANSLFVVMTVGENWRVIYQWNGTEYIQIGDKRNTLRRDNIVHEIEALSGLRQKSKGTYVVCSFVPDEFTESISVQFSAYVDVSFGDRMYYGFEDNLVYTGDYQQNINVSIPITDDQKGKTFLVQYYYAGGSSGGSVQSGTATEIRHDAYTTEYVDANHSYSNYSQSGLVPSLQSDSTAEALTPRGWDEVDFNITKDEIKTAFDETYGDQRPSNNVYSLEEQVIGTWIDGKPLYRKVLTGSWSGAWDGANYVLINNIPQPSNVAERYVKLIMCANDGSVANADLETNVASSNSGLRAKVLQNSRYNTLIFEYTKTTDAAS